MTQLTELCILSPQVHVSREENCLKKDRSQQIPLPRPQEVHSTLGPRHAYDPISGVYLLQLPYAS